MNMYHRIIPHLTITPDTSVNPLTPTVAIWVQI